MSVPPPHGMSEADYETIEAAVTETVRGRWFLGEFARRNRTAELRQLLDAMARIETVVSASAPALPPSDPSIRLIMQRVKEIAGQLDVLSCEMREAGIEPRFPDAVDHQARAVAGMMRGPGRGALPQRPEPTRVLPATISAANALPVGETSREPALLPGSLHSSLAEQSRSPVHAPGEVAPVDPRLAALSAIDSLTLAKKLALFS